MSSRVSSRVTAIVLNYGREALTIGAVESLARSQPTPPRILIVDNASPDGSGERLAARFPQHDFLQTGENLGYAGGNARGIEWALATDTDYLLVLNDDAEVAPATVAQLAAALDAASRAAAAGPTIVFDDADPTICWAGGELDLARARGLPVGPRRPGDATGTCTFVSGCCVLLRAAAVREVGGFREEYFSYVEDVELSLRFARAGWLLLYVPAARVVHHAPLPEPTPPPWKIRLRDLNRRRMVRTHYSRSQRAKFALWFYPTRLALAASYLLHRDGPRAAAIWRGMTDSLRTPSRP